MLANSTTTLVRKSGQPKCKAVSISPWIMVSAHHCVKDELTEYILHKDKHYYQLPLEILITNEVDDLALLRRSEPAEYWLPIQLWRNPQVNDKVLAGDTWSTILNLYWTGRSEVTAIYRTGIEIDMKVEHGHSGSGLVDEYGYLIGICTGFDTKNNNGIYAPASGIIILLNAWE